MHAPGDVLDVRSYDFESPELIGGDARERLDSALEAWGRQLGNQITAKTRAVVDVATAPFQVQSFGAFAGTDPGDPGAAEPAGLGAGPAVYASASLGRGRAVYRIPLAEARYWAGRMIGAAGGGTDAARPLTQIERALVQHVAEEHLQELRPATGGLLPEPFLETLGTEPSGGIDPGALAVTVAVGLLRRGERQQLTLALDVQVVLEALGAIEPRQDADEVRARIGAHLAVAPVEVALRFANTRVGPDTVLDLAEGDLIPLAHLAHQPLAITLDGEPVLRAAVGGNGERLACVVVESNGGPA